MNLIILGPQGSGKGTQAKLLAEKYGLTHISTGELFRQEVSSGSDFGQTIKNIIDKGELVPDDILFSILEKAPLKAGSGFILDGTPRNMEQAMALDGVFRKIGVKIDYVIFLDIPHQISIDRLLKRAQIEHRADDNLSAIQERLDLYQKETLPVVDYYRSRGILMEVDGVPDIDTIFKDICSRLEAVK